MNIEPRQNVWIVGALGRIGRALEYRLKQGPYNIYATDKEVDVTNLDEVNSFADANRPSIIINCAGYGHEINHEEVDQVEAYKINAIGARNLAIATEALGATLVHISTDDIFLGNEGTIFNEFDSPKPVDLFSKSKYAGERLVRSMTTHHLIIRSQWVYTAMPNDYLVRAAKAINEGKRIEIPVNQIAAPTSARVLADFIRVAIEAGEFGTFHVSCKGRCSRFEFFKRALEIMGLPTTNLAGSHTPEQAYNLQLDNLMMKLTDLYEMPDWESELETYLKLHNLVPKE